MGSLALRPGDSLTIPKMALSIGFRSFGFPPACYPSYGPSDSYPGGTVSHLTRQPLLDTLVREKTAIMPYGFPRSSCFFSTQPGSGGLNIELNP